VELDLLADFQTNFDDFSFRQAQRVCFIDFFRLYLFLTSGQLAPKTHFRVARVFRSNSHLITPSGSLKSTCVMMKLSALAPAVFSTTQFLLDSLLSRSWQPRVAEFLSSRSTSLLRRSLLRFWQRWKRSRRRRRMRKKKSMSRMRSLCPIPHQYPLVIHYVSF